MLHKAWNSKGEMPYCFPRSSIKFQGHMVQNITDFDPNWALRTIGRSQLSNPSDLPCYLSFQLLYPLGDNSPIANFLEKNKAGGMHHICIEVSVAHWPLDDTCIWEVSFHKSSFWFKQVQSALWLSALMILYKSAVNDISVLVHVKFGTEFLDQWWPSFMMSLSYSCCDGYIKLIMP